MMRCESQGDAPLVRIGLLRLTDAAPVVMADAKGFFAAEGVRVHLSVEASWANLADKLAYGLLDAAVMLPPLALAMSAGMRAASTPLVVPIGLSLNGNALTFCEPWLDAVGPVKGRDAARVGQKLAELLKNQAPLRFAVVHGCSTHFLLVRAWFAANGIDPDAAIDWSIIPPAQMVDALRAGVIDGFCAGAPWGAMAHRAGVGRTLLTSSEIWPDHPEKCLAVRAEWAITAPDAVQKTVRAVLRGALFCDDPAATPEVALHLAHPDFVNVPAEAIAASLPGGRGDLLGVDRSIFTPALAALPRYDHACWFVAQMMGADLVSGDCDPRRIAMAVYRPDLCRAAAADLGIVLPVETPFDTD